MLTAAQQIHVVKVALKATERVSLQHKTLKETKRHNEKRQNTKQCKKELFNLQKLWEASIQWNLISATIKIVLILLTQCLKMRGFRFPFSLAHIGFEPCQFGLKGS